MALLCLVVGKVSAYDWTGNTVNTTDEFYLYNVGFKAFLTSEGTLVDNPSGASKWKFSSTSNGTISSDGNYIYVEQTWTWAAVTYASGGKAEVRSSTWNVKIEQSTTTTNTTAYKFSHYASKKYGWTTYEGTRYFNVDNNSGAITGASTASEDNDWLLITQAQVDEYNDQSESWESEDPANGTFYLYNVYYGKYMHAYDEGGYIEMKPTVAEATAFTLAENNGKYSIGSDGKYVYQNSNKDFGLNNSPYYWTFVSANGSYQIHSNTYLTKTQYLVGSDDNGATSIYHQEISDIRKSYWILISEEQYEEDMNLKINIPSNGYTTYSNNSSAIDFSNSDLTVYYASSVTKDMISFTKINDNIIPKGEGVLIKGTEGEHDVKVSTSDNSLSTNYLKAGDDQAHEGSYALAAKSDGSELGFYKLNSSVTIPYGKAYLTVPSDVVLKVKNFILNDSNFDEDEITAIRVVAEDNEADAPAYSVTGVKVGKNYKGLVIKNGKTYIQK